MVSIFSIPPAQPQTHVDLDEFTFSGKIDHFNSKMQKMAVPRNVSLRLIISFAAALSLLDAQTPADPLLAAQERLKQHDLKGAADLLQKASTQHPEAPEIWTALGKVDYLRGDFTEAEMDFKHALKVNNKFATAWVGLGRVFEAACLREKAKVCYRTAWREDSSDPEIRRYYARTLSPSEQLAGLEDFLAKAGERDDPETVDQARRQAAQLKWMDNREPFALASPLAHTEIKLSDLLFDSRRIRGFSVPVSFNGGKTLHLLLDSGAGGIVLNEKAALAAGLQKIADLKFWGIGNEGDRTGYTAFAESVRAGDVQFKNCPVAVSDKKFLTDEDGLIGPNVFSKFLVTIDFQKRLLKLDPLPPLKTRRPTRIGTTAKFPRSSAPTLLSGASVTTFCCPRE